MPALLRIGWGFSLEHASNQNNVILSNVRHVNPGEKETVTISETPPTSAVFATPSDPSYANAVAPYNVAAIPAPAMAVTVRTRTAARAALREARGNGLPVRVLATGHSADSVAPFDGQALIRVELEETVVIDPESQTATIPAGARWSDVVVAAERFGLVALHGSSGTVGAIGYLLGGGMSFYGRAFGVASNSVTSITLLTADGREITVHADNDPELFWALRGGGTGFGIVLSLTMRLFEVGPIFTGSSFFSIEHAKELLDVWDDWSRTAPRSVSTSFRVLNLPPLPHIPPLLSGRPVICVDGVALDSDGLPASDAAGVLLGRLAQVAAPLLETWHHGTPSDATATHMDPPDPMPVLADHFVLSELPNEARTRLAELAQPEHSSALAFIELRQLGGAFADPVPGGGAVNHFAGSYALVSAGVLLGPDAGPVVGAQLGSVRSELRDWDAGITVPTAVSSYSAPQRSFDHDTAVRVASIRDRVDPDGVFRGGIARGSLVSP